MVKYLKLFLIIVLTSSCCKEKDENSGAIQYELSIDNSDCIYLPNQLCIRDDSTYQSLFGVSAKCQSVSLPSVDFEKNSILIYDLEESGRVYFHRNVVIDSVNKKVQYNVSTAKCYCPDKCINKNEVIVVPKIPKDYTVVFN